MWTGIGVFHIVLLATAARSQETPFDAVREAFGDAASQHEPFSAPCFRDWESPQCVAIRENYRSASYRSNVPSSMIHTQWETCQTTGEQCLLDATDPNNRVVVNQTTCSNGSVPDYFVEVSDWTQVRDAFKFSRDFGVPLVVKNTGHDYSGRSSGPGTLALWTHNLKQRTFHRNFKPEGCSKIYETAITVGAGVQFNDLFAFADENNVTVVGGADASVGASGGFVLGGGHGALSNTHGLAADRILQFKVVTPDGQYRTVNACQNQDLYFALRGGGGAFAVVLETTHIATPRVTLQAVFLTFSPATFDPTKQLWSVLIDNGVKWAEEGWGGYSTAGVFIYINPVIDAVQAAESMEPIVELAERLEAAGVANVSLVQTTFPNFLSWYKVFAAANAIAMGVNLPLSSRLIPKKSFATAESRAELLAAYENAYKTTPRLIIHMTAPASYAGDGQTSFTPAWRDSVWHNTLVTLWDWNATEAQKIAAYRRVSESVDHLRRVTPDASYNSEADVYEPNHQLAFWGSNYDRLLSIKNRYDPDRLLDCWQCVGSDESSPRFRCYLPHSKVKL